MKAYVGNEFDALRIRYEDQLNHLRILTSYDFRIFSGFLTLQLIIAGWLAKSPITSVWSQLGICSINATLAVIAIGLLYCMWSTKIQKKLSFLGDTVSAGLSRQQGFHPSLNFHFLVQRNIFQLRDDVHKFFAQRLNILYALF